MRHTTSDLFHISDYFVNWERLDDAPGLWICESNDRPLWGERQEGMSIYETDTQLIWTWDGSGWDRLIPRGLLGINSATTAVDTTSTSFQTALSTNVNVVEGNRYHQITVSAPGVHSTEDLTEVAIFRDSTQLQAWFQQGGVDSGPEHQPRPIAHTLFDLPTPGTINYSLRYRAVSGLGGTSTIEAGANSPIQISVVEV